MTDEQFNTYFENVVTSMTETITNLAYNLSKKNVDFDDREIDGYASPMQDNHSIKPEALSNSLNINFYY
jgi:hypothetical protein